MASLMAAVEINREASKGLSLMHANIHNISMHVAINFFSSFIFHNIIIKKTFKLRL